jgi:hypothetical protein
VSSGFYCIGIDFPCPPLLEGGFSVLTGTARLNIISAKLYKTILARGKRKMGSSFQKKEPIFLSRNAVFLLALSRDAFHLATIRRLR